VALTDALVAGEKIQFVGFGSFEVRQRAEKKARNPQTGEEVISPATRHSRPARRSKTPWLENSNPEQKPPDTLTACTGRFWICRELLG